jgi:PhnB protein
MTNKQPVFTKDIPNKQLTIVKDFDAPVDLVWKAWTQSDILDQWWAPKPWKAETKTMDFRVGGQWLYCMVGPNGEKHWCRVDYKAIEPQVSISSDSAFVDEEGQTNTNLPSWNWLQQFRQTSNGMTVTVVLTFGSEASMEEIITMGFQQGFTMGLSNLDEYLSRQRRPTVSLPII